MLYLFVVALPFPDLCSRTLRCKSLVTPVYRTVLFLLVMMQTQYCFSVISLYVIAHVLSEMEELKDTQPPHTAGDCFVPRSDIQLCRCER